MDKALLAWPKSIFINLVIHIHLYIPKTNTFLIPIKPNLVSQPSPLPLLLPLLPPLLERLDLLPTQLPLRTLGP